MRRLTRQTLLISRLSININLQWLSIITVHISLSNVHVWLNYAKCSLIERRRNQRRINPTFINCPMTLPIFGSVSSRYQVTRRTRIKYEAQKRSRRARFRRTDRQTAACNGDDMIRTVLLLLTGRGLRRRDRGRRSIVNRLMWMHGVDGRRGHMGQGRRRRARLMMIVMMMNVAPPGVESISAPVDDRRLLRGQVGGSAAQNRGARRAAARHGAAGHDYGWKTDGMVLDVITHHLFSISSRDSVASRAQMSRNNRRRLRSNNELVFYAAW